ncbi:hypothetical protein V8G61_09265, partial [Gaetbulibacter sp. M240]|uniref:hypothetical protein n=1 Tax=Gaetbulibacter sp. M240 TaxID=3126511 RepID=UPI00374EA8C5
TKEDGTTDIINKADLTDNLDGTYTFTNNDGTDVTFNAGGLVDATDDNAATEIKKIATITKSDGTEVDVEETVTNLVDNADGTFTYTKEDGTTDIINKADLTDNLDGTYTFTNNDGTDVTFNAGGLVDATDDNAATEIKKIATIIKSDGTEVDVEETVTSVIQAIGNEDTDVTNGDAKTIATYTNENGDTATVNETTTSLNLVTNDNTTPGDLTDDFEELTYTDENGTANVIMRRTTVTKMVFNAEYAGAVIQADGTDNSLSINTTNSGAPTFMNYYEASNYNQDGGFNDYNVVLRVTLPDDFDSWSSDTDAIVIDFEGTSDATFEADIFEEGNAMVLKDNMPVLGTGVGGFGFAETTIAVAGDLTDLVAEDTFVIVIKLTVTDVAIMGDSLIRIGDITLNYNRKRF